MEVIPLLRMRHEPLADEIVFGCAQYPFDGLVHEQPVESLVPNGGPNDVSQPVFSFTLMLGGLVQEE